MITHFPGNRLLTIHNQESEVENEFLEKGSGDFHRLYNALHIDISSYKARGQRSLQSHLSHFLSHQSLILVHNVTTNNDDLAFIASGESIANLFFCLCPNANEYIGNPLPDIDLLRHYQAVITIGTDSLASNNQLSVLAELQTIHTHYPHIEIKELLTWATLNGARALQLDSVLGSFEPGKQPGILVVNEELTEVNRIL